MTYSKNGLTSCFPLSSCRSHSACSSFAFSSSAVVAWSVGQAEGTQGPPVGGPVSPLQGFLITCASITFSLDFSFSFSS